MNRTAVALMVLSLVAAACGADSTAPDRAGRLSSKSGADTLATMYILRSVNGAALPCCTHPAPDGKTEQWAGAVITRAANGSYTWTASLAFKWQPDSVSYFTKIVDSVVAQGRISRQGDSVLFSDAVVGASFIGSVDNDTMTVIRDGTNYRFTAKPAPSLFETRWPEAACNDAALPAGCPRTDSAGVVSTVTGGELTFDDDLPAGHYLWMRTYQYLHPDGSVDTATVRFSEGTYQLDGTLVTLTDSNHGLGTMHGHFDGQLSMQAGSEFVKFMTLIELPGG